MGRSHSPKRLRYTAQLPQELWHIIFAKLDLKDKLNVGLVCKHWDQLLRAGTADAEHWRVEYNLDTIWSSASIKTLKKGPPQDRLDSIIEGCATALTPSVTGRNVPLHCPVVNIAIVHTLGLSLGIPSPTAQRVLEAPRFEALAVPNWWQYMRNASCKK